MTQWRDARLAQALAQAPDDGRRPAPAVRAAVLESARRAVAGNAPAAPVPVAFWRRAWEAMGRAGQPWNGALATVVLACLVTVLWWDKPVPDAAVDGPPLRVPDAQVGRQADLAPAPTFKPGTPAPAAVPAEASAVPVPAQTAAANRAPRALEKEAVAPTLAVPTPGPAPAPNAAAAPAPVAAAEPAIAARPAPAITAPPSAVPQSPAAAMSDARPDAPTAGSAQRSKAAEAVAAPASPPMPAPAPAAAPALRREVAPAPVARDLAESSSRSAAAGGLAAQSADQAPGAPGRMPELLSITLEGKALAFTPAQAQQIEALVQALAAQAGRGELLQTPAIAVITVRRDRASAGVLQLAPPQVRWMPMRPGAQPLTGRPDAAQLQSLLEVLQQLPER